MFNIQVFALTVIFGLFHGLVLFPVVLSLVGPVNNTELLTDSTLTINTETSSCKTSPVSSASNTPKGGHDNLAFLQSEKKPHILDQTWIDIQTQQNT